MFEQAVLPNPDKKANWMFLVATSFEILAIAAVIVAPLLFLGPLRITPPPPPRAALRYLPHVDLVRVERNDFAQHSPIISHPMLSNLPFVAPVKTPTQIPIISDLQAPDIGIPTTGSGGPTGVPFGDITGEPRTLSPPPQAPPAAVKEKPTGLLHVSQGVQEAKLINKVMPRYPEMAIRTRQFGTVHLLAIIGKDGHVKTLQVLDGPVFLRAAAVEAIKQWIYKPTLLNGEPVEVMAPIEVHFTLSN